MAVEYNNYKIVKTWKQIKQLVNWIKTTKVCSFDFETTSNEFQQDKEVPTIIGISFQPGSSYIIPLAHFDSPFKHEWVKVLRYLSKEVFEDKDIMKLAFNAKFEHKWLFKYYCNMRGRIFDTMLAKYLLNEEKPNDLKSLVLTLLPEFAGYEHEMDQLVAKHGWAGVPLKPLSKYCGLDCDLNLRLFIILEPKLIQHNFYLLFRNMLMMAHRVLMESEFSGIYVNKPYLDSLVPFYKNQIDEAEKRLRYTAAIRKFENWAVSNHHNKLTAKIRVEIDKLNEELESTKDEARIKRLNKSIEYRETKISAILANGPTPEKQKYAGINFGSPVQLQDFLYNSPKGLRLPVVEYSEAGKPSTSEDTLTKLSAQMEQKLLKKSLNKKKRKKYEFSMDFFKTLFEYRGLTKLYSTYVIGIQERITTKDRVHAGFLIHGTVTGRLSSRDPNLQNIPRDTTSSMIKPMFIPPKGMLLLEVDYSQAELRVVAELAKEKVMIEWFSKGYNIHVATACKMNHCMDRYDEIKAILKDPNHPENEHWEKQKKKAKTVNFGILYGQTKFKLAESLKCTPDEAQVFLDEWFEAFPAITKYIRKQHRFVEKHGYVKSLWGRKRRLPDARCKDDKDMRGFYLKAMRDSINAPIQGASNDFTVFSSVIIREDKLMGKLPWDLQQAYTVHDSLGFYVHPEDIHWVTPMLVNICDNPETKEWFGFRMKYVKMKVSPEIGINWGSLREYNPEEDYTKWVNEEAYLNQYKQTS